MEAKKGKKSLIEKDELLDKVIKEVHVGFMTPEFLEMKYNINKNRAKKIIKQVRLVHLSSFFLFTIFF